MNFFWSIIIATHLISLIFLGLGLLRYLAYKRRNIFVESKYTLLFGVVGMNHMIVSYIVFVLVYTLGAILFVFYLSSL